MPSRNLNPKQGGYKDLLLFVERMYIYKIFIYILFVSYDLYHIKYLRTNFSLIKEKLALKFKDLQSLIKDYFLN